jgi:hypothetical protein
MNNELASLPPETWASIITAGATLVLAALTWRTVQAMSQQLTAPKRDKHLDWVNSEILTPLKAYIGTYLQPAVRDHVLPALIAAEEPGPEFLKPDEALPLCRGELTAHFKNVAERLDTLTHAWERLVQSAWDFAVAECTEELQRSGIGIDPSKIVPYCYRYLFAASTHLQTRNLLSSDGKWHFTTSTDITGFDFDFDTKDRAEELRAAIARIATKGKGTLTTDFQFVLSSYNGFMVAIDSAMATVQLKGTCDLCPFE